MKLVRISKLFFTLFLLFAIIFFIVIVTAPRKHSFFDELEASIVTINSCDYIFITSSAEEVTRNPLYPIEFVDYKFINNGQIGITKYKEINFIPLLRNAPLLNTLPIVIPTNFINDSSVQIESLYYTDGHYKHLKFLERLSPDEKWEIKD